MRPSLSLSAFLVVLLSGCTSAGKQYQFPAENEPYATFKGASETFIYQTDERDCYVGRTEVTRDAKLHVGREVIVEATGYTNVGTIGLQCSATFALMPKVGAKYGIEIKRDARGRAETLDFSRCDARLVEFAPDGSVSIVPHRPVRLRVGLRCLRGEPSKQMPSIESAK